KPPYMRVALTQGSRLTLTGVSCDGKRLMGHTPYGIEVRIALDDIASVLVFSDRVAYLSDVKPAKVELTSYLPGESSSVRNDRSAAGNSLMLGGQAYDKGLGTPSGTRITYPLDGKYARFEAIVGLDDRTGKKGSVRVRIVVDGK